MRRLPKPNGSTTTARERQRGDTGRPRLAAVRSPGRGEEGEGGGWVYQVEDVKRRRWCMERDSAGRKRKVSSQNFVRREIGRAGESGGG